MAAAVCHKKSLFNWTATKASTGMIIIDRVYVQSVLLNMGQNVLLYTKTNATKIHQQKHLLKINNQNYKNILLLFSDSIYKVYKGESYNIICIILIDKFIYNLICNFRHISHIQNLQIQIKIRRFNWGNIILLWRVITVPWKLSSPVLWWTL